nr:hypothetical protein [Tanacetum cinerariifolium]
ELRETKANKEEHHLNERNTSLVIGRKANIETDEGTHDHSKMKLKGVSNVPSDAQFLLDIKKARQASRNEYILQLLPKGPGEGSIVVLDTPDDQSDSPSHTLSSAEYGNKFLNNNANFSLNDVLKDPVQIKNQSMVDVPIQEDNPAIQEIQLVDVVVAPSPVQTTHSPKTQSPKTKPPQSKTKIILKKPKKFEEKVNAEAILKRLMKLENKFDAIVDAEESIQDDDVTEQDKSKWFKQDVVERPETPDPCWFTKPNMNDSLEQNWFNEMVNAEKDPKEFDNMMGSTINFTKFTKNCLQKDKITKAGLEGLEFALVKGNFKNIIKLEYNLEQCYLALTGQID